MENDVIFDITSMSKTITAAGALKLYDEGGFLLDDPVKKYLPQFKNLRVMVNMGTDSSMTTGLERDVTIRDLFRHTAGFGYGWGSDTIDYLYRLNRLNTANQTPEKFLNAITGIPLKYQPGSWWEYSYSIDILGLVIEKITGKSLQDYLKSEIFNPLKMRSSGFYIKEKDINRLSAYYTYTDGKLKYEEYPLPMEYLKIPGMCWGGAGIVTTAGDLANFCNMILNFGNFNGRQVLKAETVELMITDQISGIKEQSSDVPGYGLGVGVIADPTTGKTASVFWKGSPFNTSFVIDINKQVIAIFLTRNGPFGHLDITSKFSKLVYENLY
jgi:CubicO group peptidase (beta-lactamase class C family)